MVAAAAGTGAPTNPSSRYYGAAVEFYTEANGVQVAYLQRRIIPQASIYTSPQTYAISDGDRLDNLAYKFLGDPILYWMICDANSAVDPNQLTATPGYSIQIPLAAGIPSGARNG
jgi:base plate wedge protein 53